MRPWTLQFYVSRELVKTFALTAIGLILTFTLCGSVFQMVEADVLGAVQMVRLLAFVLPLAATLTLPVSALFACAIVYGRFSADNEFDACRASGINIHRLLLPAAALGVLTAGSTFTLANYVVPSSATRLEEVIRADLQKIFLQALKMRGYLPYQDFILHASDPQLVHDPETGADVIDIRHAAFMQIEDDELVTCGTADAVRVDFYSEGLGSPRVGASLYNIQAMNLPQDIMLSWARQRIESDEIPMQIEQKPKFLPLSKLLRFRRHPSEFPEMRQQVGAVRRLVRDALFYRYVNRQLNGPEKMLRLADGRHRYEIHADRCRLDDRDFLPVVEGVTVKHWWEDRYREYRADRCTIEVERDFSQPTGVVRLALIGNVTFTDAIDTSIDTVQLNQHDLDDVALPAAVLAEEEAISDNDLLGLSRIQAAGVTDPDRFDEVLDRLQLGPRVRKARTDALAGLIKLQYKITGVIHSRLAFCTSALVTLLLAAALGIIFRGGQLLTAFVIAFVPGLLVVVNTIWGQRMTENSGTHLIGIGIIWAGIGLMALADAVVLTRYLRR